MKMLSKLKSKLIEKVGQYLAPSTVTPIASQSLVTQTTLSSPTTKTSSLESVKSNDSVEQESSSGSDQPRLPVTSDISSTTNLKGNNNMSFSVKTVGHFFAVAAHDVKVGVQFLVSHESQIDKGLQVGAAVVSLVDPALAGIATAIDRAGEAALGEVLGTVDKLTADQAKDGWTVTFSADAYADFKALLANIEALKPGSTVVPASLTSPAVKAA
jgi:hypothetical protein